MTSTVLVMGATGTVGGATVSALLGRGAMVSAFVRDPDRALEKLGPDVDQRRGDLGDAASVRQALDGVGSVLLCSGHDPQMRAHQIAALRVMDAGGGHPRGAAGAWAAAVAHRAHRADERAAGRPRAAVVTDTVADITGRKPITLEPFLQDHASQFGAHRTTTELGNVSDVARLAGTNSGHPRQERNHNGQRHR